MQTPPFAGSAASTSSGTFRGTSHAARAPEWLNSTGRRAIRSACRITSADTCERSTSMPIRSISATTRSPAGLSPWCTCASVAESAQATFASA